MDIFKHFTKMRIEAPNLNQDAAAPSAQKEDVKMTVETVEKPTQVQNVQSKI